MIRDIQPIEAKNKIEIYKDPTILDVVRIFQALFDMRVKENELVPAFNLLSKYGTGTNEGINQLDNVHNPEAYSAWIKIHRKLSEYNPDLDVKKYDGVIRKQGIVEVCKSINEFCGDQPISASSETMLLYRDQMRRNILKSAENMPLESDVIGKHTQRLLKAFNL